MHNNKSISTRAILSFSLAVLFFGTINSSQASSAPHHVVSARHVNAIQTKQAKSIEAGVRLGRLTPKEARKLREEQHEIISIERDMRKDGSLNGTELSKLFKKLQYAQDHINKLLRNNISTHRKPEVHNVINTEEN